MRYYSFIEEREKGDIMRNRIGSIGMLVIAVLFTAVGAWAYSSGYILKLFGLIPLSGTAFVIIAVILLVSAVYNLVRAPKQDQAEQQHYQAQVSAVSQQQQQQQQQQPQGAAAPGGTSQTQLSAPCTVTIKHTKGVLGLVNRIAVVCNGTPVGELKNKGSLQFSTSVAENTVTVIRSDTDATASIDFSAQPGGTVDLNVTLDLMNNVAIRQV